VGLDASLELRGEQVAGVEERRAKAPDGTLGEDGLPFGSVPSALGVRRTRDEEEARREVGGLHRGKEGWAHDAR